MFLASKLSVCVFCRNTEVQSGSPDSMKLYVRKKLLFAFISSRLVNIYTQKETRGHEPVVCLVTNILVWDPKVVCLFLAHYFLNLLSAFLLSWVVDQPGSFCVASHTHSHTEYLPLWNWPASWHGCPCLLRLSLQNPGLNYPNVHTNSGSWSLKDLLPAFFSNWQHGCNWEWEQ